MRVKTGIVRRRRHNKMKLLAKGYRGRRKNCYKFIKNSVEHGLEYAYADRRRKKRDFRKLWITRINAAARINGLSYSVFMNGLKQANIDLDRKVLADIAVNDPEGFATICEQSKSAVAA